VTPPAQMLGLAFRQTQGHELPLSGSGLTLSGALHPALKGGAWRRRMGQLKTMLHMIYLKIIMGSPM